ncbi:hypothetical protein BTO06_08775 [Tenacibaculum sp. SZ-18]|uniref:hypothetical protein n=1 Tax=Tenacibaculum sp. SZ-18 TaxID=754423 RepID=UPI000C2D097A|nr:hypothetical protein [Tenacibaculum sp. SZ-18]AUC15225.1 hypothetical protein BTO06_08775 [Tenacibaculum sp. SZ-18]
MKKILLLICAITFIQCNINSEIKKDRISTILYEELESNDIESEYINVILINEFDCHTCINDFINQNDNDFTVGLYLSKNEVKFKEKLDNISSNIKWYSLKNAELLTNLMKDNEYKGPYLFQLIGSQYKLQSYF